MSRRRRSAQFTLETLEGRGLMSAFSWGGPIYLTSSGAPSSPTSGDLVPAVHSGDLVPAVHTAGGTNGILVGL